MCLLIDFLIRALIEDRVVVKMVARDVTSVAKEDSRAGPVAKGASSRRRLYSD